MARNNNYSKVVSYLNSVFHDRTIEDFCYEFGYKDYIRGLLTFDEEEFSKKFEKEYKRIVKSFDKKRRDVRSPFDTARDICSNFIMEDLLVQNINRTYPDVEITLNEKEKRDIETEVSDLPDFIFTNLDNNSKIRFDLKIDWNGKFIKHKKFFFRGNEDKEYKKFGAVALIWCPAKGRFTFVDFRGEVKGERGIDETKGGKEGFWANLEDLSIGEIYFGKSLFLDDMLRRLDRLSRI